MADAVIRRAAEADRSALQALWETVFGDPPELIQAFFAHFPPEASGWIVSRGEELCSAAYLLTGNRLVSGGHSRPCAYVYAVATPEPERGHGYASRLMRHFAQMADAHGVLLYTRPAEPGLYAWYRDVMGASATGTGSETVVQRAAQTHPDLALRPVDPIEYGRLRELRLAHTPHVALSGAFLALQAEYSRAADGALLALGDGCAITEVEEGTLLVKELLVPELQRPDAVQTLLRRFDLDTAIVRWQGGSGAALPFAAFRPFAPEPEEAVNWGLFLD